MERWTKGLVADFWEAEACGERYGDEQERRRYELEPQIASFADFAGTRGLDVLEIGVGMGADAVRFARAGARLTGIDLTARAVEITRRRLEAEKLETDVRVADAEALPFADDSFDLVWSWGVLHHTPDPQAAFAEAVRVLRPGGRLKAMVYHRRSWLAAAAWIRFCLLRGRPRASMRDAVNHVESPGTQAFTTNEIADVMASAELADISVRPSLTVWDRRVAPGLSSLVGDRAGWFLLVEGVKERGH